MALTVALGNSQKIAVAPAGNSSSASTTDSATPIATPTPVPTPIGNSLGTEVPTTAGDKVTALAYEGSVSSNNQFNTPPPGGVFAAANVKICAGGSSLDANPATWALVMTDYSRVNGTDAGLNNVPGNPLTFVNVSPGDCTSGWIVFAVPAGEVPVKLQIQNADFYWTLS